MKNLSTSSSSFNNFSPVTLWKLVLDERSSVFALIKFAFAPANDDSDCAKSVKVISPFCNLALSNSTCLSNKSKLDLLNLSFLNLNM